MKNARRLRMSGPKSAIHIMKPFGCWSWQFNNWKLSFSGSKEFLKTQTSAHRQIQQRSLSVHERKLLTTVLTRPNLSRTLTSGSSQFPQPTELRHFGAHEFRDPGNQN